MNFFYRILGTIVLMSVDLASFSRAAGEARAADWRVALTTARGSATMAARNEARLSRLSNRWRVVRCGMNDQTKVFRIRSRGYNDRKGVNRQNLLLFFQNKWQ
jgi:hypothetical protein